MTGALALLAFAWGCGNDVMFQPSSGGSGGASATGTSTSTSGAGGSIPGGPPAPPANAPMGDGGGVVLAWSKIFLGDTDTNGAVSSIAWQHFGYNIDGKVSNATSLDHCQPHTGANPKQIKTDGPNGLDNSWGKTLVPIIISLSSDASGKLNDGLAKGGAATLARIDALGANPDYLGLPAALYSGAKLGYPPHYDGSDKWPVAAESLANPNDVNSALAKFPASYLTGNTWVSGPSASFDLPVTLAFAGTPMVVTVRRAIVTMQLSADRKSATNGIVAGVIPVELFIAEMKKAAGAINKDLCSGPTLDSLTENLRQAADMNADGTNDPMKECDGISIGIGFEAKIVQLGAIAPAQPPPPDPCK